MTSRRTGPGRAADDPADGPADGPDGPADGPPVVLEVVAALVLLEVAALVAAAGWAVAVLVGGRSDAPGTTAALAVFALGVAAVLLAAVRALRRGSRRARGPLVTWQLLQAATGLTLVGAAGAPPALTWLAGGALVLAVAVVAAVLSPAASRRTTD